MRAILTYHSIDTSGSPISTSPDVFKQHVDWLVSGRVLVTSIADLMSTAPERDAVAITFDDAFVNFLTEAFPLLSRHGLPVTLFVVSDRAGRDNQWHGRGDRGIPIMPLLGWTELRDLANCGVSLGAHSRTHPDLSQLDERALEQEVFGSADRLAAETGAPPRLFAYPYGRVNDRVAHTVSRRFSWACTTEFNTLHHTAAPSRLPRLDAYYFQSTPRLQQWGTRAFERYVLTRRSMRLLRDTLNFRWPSASSW